MAQGIVETQPTLTTNRDQVLRRATPITEGYVKASLRFTPVTGRYYGYMVYAGGY